MLFKFRNLITALILLSMFPLQAKLHKKHVFTVMLDPAGDGKNVGRTLYTNFERGATMQFAQELKLQILQKYSHVEVVFTKNAGETLEILQSASFANRLDVDLYLSLNFYKEVEVKPNIFIFYFKNQNFFSFMPQTTLHFHPYHKAFTTNFNQTKCWAEMIQKDLQQKKYHHYFNCKNATGIPFRPLIGIMSPAIGIEIGVNKSGWKNYITPIVNSLSGFIHDKK
jgi:N-acetylmuramoyl-L-alanine amidase